MRRELVARELAHHHGLLLREHAGVQQLVRDLKGLGLSVIVVVTKATTFRNNSFEAKIREEVGDLVDGIVLTRGIAEPQYDDDDNVIGERPELPRDRPIVVHCQMGGRSAKVTAQLRARGYDARNLTGGIQAWLRHIR